MTAMPRTIHVFQVDVPGAVGFRSCETRDITHSRMGNSAFLRTWDKTCECCSRSSTHERGASVLSTCSNLNFSAQAITGRHTNLSSRTMTAIIVATPQMIEVVSPLLAAVCRYEPKPGRRKSRVPSTNISQAISANQPPATDIIEFQTKPMAAKGNSTSVNRCHQLNR